MGDARRVSGCVVGLMLLAAGPALGAAYTAKTQVRVGRGGANNQFTTLYGATNLQEDLPSTAYSTMSDYGSFYNDAPGAGANTSLWAARSAAQAGPGFLRVYAEVEALTAGPNNRFTSSSQMVVNGNRAGRVESDGTVRVTPEYLANGQAEMFGRITPNASDPELAGEAGAMQVRVDLDGFASYSEGFYQQLFGGQVSSETSVRITVGTASTLERFTLDREFYWDYNTKPFADSGPMGGTVTLDAPIVFGESYDLKIEVWTWVQIAGYGSVNIGGDGFSLPQTMHTVIADYHNTATWAGVTLFDGEGAAVTGGATLDGEDYSGAFVAPPAPALPPIATVPEPATVAMLAAVWGLVGWRRR